MTVTYYPKRVLPLDVEIAASSISVRTWVGLGLLFLTLSQLIHVDADPDLWGHLRFGWNHLETGVLARFEPYSYTAPGHPWTNHEWLCEWLMAWCYRAGGPWGLLCLRGILFLTVFLVLGRLASRYRAQPWFLWVAGGFLILILGEFYRLRPQMFTYTCMATMLWLCDHLRPHPERTNTQRWAAVWCLPVLMLVWTNLHAGFVAGLGIFCVHVLAELWRSRHDASRQVVWTQLVGVSLAVLLSTWINPYGPGYWKFVLHAVLLDRPQITEWQGILSQNWVVLLCYLAATLLPLLAWFCAPRRYLEREDIVFVLGAIMAARHARHLPFLLLFAFVLLLRRYPDLEERLRQSASGLGIGPAARRRLILVGALGLAVPLLISGASNGLSRASSTIAVGPVSLDTSSYPTRAVEFIKRSGLQGNLDCGFNWGEYCLFHLYPACRVFCDGRYETCYPSEVSRLVLAPGPDMELWSRRRDDYGTNMVLLPVEDPFGRWLSEGNGFVEVYRDPTARLLLRHDHPALPHLWATQTPLPERTVSTESQEIRRVSFPG